MKTVKSVRIIRVDDRLFYSTLHTLEKIPYFKTLLSTKVYIDKENDNHIFIDRKHTYFKYILNFARECTYNNDELKTLSKNELKVLRYEADFYNYEDLVEVIDNIYKNKCKPKKKNTQLLMYTIKQMGINKNKEYLFGIYHDNRQLEVFIHQLKINKLDINDILIYLRKHLPNYLCRFNDNEVFTNYINNEFQIYIYLWQSSFI
jgi:hypothetical protein